MSADLRLGRIAGVEVSLSWSVLFIAWLLAWSLASSLLPQQVPGMSATVYWFAGAVAALLFFVSLLAHELAHAIVAQRAGLEVDGITLWLFGGVAQLRGEASTPRDEAWIAGVGPLTSLVVAAAAWVASLPFAGGTPTVVGATLQWLAMINLVLAIFNVLPAAPLDGGRLLRALVWGRTGDRLRATTVASRAGQVLGGVLVALGLAEFAFQANLGGVWTLLIGGFLILAASAENRSAQLRNALGGVTVREVMTAQPVTVRDWMTVTELLDEHARAHRFTTYPLTGFDGRVSGVTTLTRLTKVPPQERTSTRLRDTAVPVAQVATARADEPVVELVGRLPTSVVRRALVYDGDDLVGIVSPSDVNRAMQLGGRPLHRAAGTAAGDPPATPVTDGGAATGMEPRRR